MQKVVFFPFNSSFSINEDELLKPFFESDEINEFLSKGYQVEQIHQINTPQALLVAVVFSVPTEL